MQVLVCYAEDKQKTFYENDQIKTEIQYKDGKQDGVFKRYYKNGILQSESTYRDGKLDGITKEYYYNGKLKAEISYQNGKMKYCKLYDLKGNLIADR